MERWFCAYNHCLIIIFRWLPLVLVALGLLPWLLVYYRRLWQLEHFQHAPLALALLAAVIVTRTDWNRVRTSLSLGPAASNGAAAGLGPAASLEPGWSVIGLGLAWGTAVWLLNSPWLAMFGSVAIAATVLGRLHDRQTGASLARWSLLLVGLIRLPLGADQWLRTELQSLSTLIAARLLDLLGIVSQQTGHWLLLPNSLADGVIWQVQPECSGVQSVHALAFVALAWGLIRSLQLRAIGVLLIAAGTVALLGNSLRILTLIGLGEAWAEGWRHELLGAPWVLLQATSLLALAQLMPRQPPQASFQPPAPPVTDAFPISLSESARSGRSLRAVIAIAGALVWSVVSWMGALKLVADPIARLTPQNAPWQADLLAELDEWRLVRFQQQTRDRGSDWGRWSDHWQLVYSPGPQATETEQQCRGLSGVASFDYPFSNWHEVTGCYQGLGWRVVDRRIRRSPLGPSVEVSLQRLDEHAILCFGLMDETGQALEPMSWQTLDRSLWSRVCSRWNSPSSLAAVQVQFFIHLTQPAGAKEWQLARKGFDQTWMRCVQCCRTPLTTVGAVWAASGDLKACSNFREVAIVNAGNRVRTTGQGVDKNRCSQVKSLKARFPQGGGFTAASFSVVSRRFQVESNDRYAALG